MADEGRGERSARAEWSRSARRTTRSFGAGLVALVLGLVVGALPEAWRPRRPVDVQSTAGWSGLLQAVLGLVLFIVGLIFFVEGLFDALMAAAEARAATTPGDDELEMKMSSAALLWTNPLLPLAFALTTPQGFLSFALFAGGVYRGLHFAATSENTADPTLLAIDWVHRKLSKRAAHAARERRKGEAAPDRLIDADGSRGWHRRLVTREDLPWREGMHVVFEDGAYRIVEIAETCDGAGRLRLRYDLRRLAGAEAARAPVPYRPAEPPVRERWSGAPTPR